MAVLEIVTNCSLRKRNPISCRGGSVVVTCVELAQRKHSAAGERESTDRVRSGSRSRIKGVGMILPPNIKITRELREKDAQCSERERKASGRLPTPHYGVMEARVSPGSACPLLSLTPNSNFRVSTCSCFEEVTAGSVTARTQAQQN